MRTTPNLPVRRRARTVVVAGVAATLVLIAAACGGDDDDAAPTTVADTEPATTEALETTVPETTEAPTTPPPTSPPTTLAPTTTTEAVIPRMPLTGVPLEFGQTVPDRPALVVKIDNHPDARPQSGLNDADIVFEEVVEFGTRFAAVFHSGNANPVGPIRSGRTQDVDLLSGLHQPLFAWSGGNPGVTRVIAESDFIDLNPNAYRVYRRLGNNGAPHNYYSNTDELFAQFTPDDVGRPTPLFSYLRPGEAPTGDPGTRAEFNMDANDVLWEFDPATNLYLRSTDGRPHDEALTNRQVDTTNVVILETPYRPSFVDARSPEAITLGGGTAWVLSGGVVRQGVWLRDVREDGIALFDADGAAIPLQAGRTWVELFDPVDGVPAIS